MAKILIVDDENSIKFLYERVFKKEVTANELTLLFSSSGEEALEIIRDNEDIHLVISDINMPGLSGFELLREAKSVRPALPIYMSSAYCDSERQSLARELGADDYIVKPVDFKALKIKISLVTSE